MDSAPKAYNNKANDNKAYKAYNNKAYKAYNNKA
jgi:hypothetical protein